VTQLTRNKIDTFETFRYVCFSVAIGRKAYLADGSACAGSRSR
jgi:hypothetical protein